MKQITITDADVDLGKIPLHNSVTSLQQIIVKGEALPSQQRGDTTQFNANAFKTQPDATSEDLVTKMPGVVNDNGTLKHNGEEIKQVLVDGKPFFGDDANATLKNLPADIIDKIQIFDKSSDQSQFTGYNDGNQQKTLNIVTKPERRNGTFGKIYAGYGTEDRYIAGFSVNRFKGVSRFTLIGLSNNINQQNFNMQDLAGVIGTGGSGNNNRGGMRPDGRPSGSGGYRVGGSANSFFVGQQPGIATTHAAGLNYSDEYKTKLKFSGSYFFNASDNENISTVTRSYFTIADTNLTYKQNSSTKTESINHRINLRLEYAIDSNNSFVFTPRLNLQSTDTRQDLFINSNLGNGSTASENHTLTNSDSYNGNGSLLYRHRFLKKGRTISLELNTTQNNKDVNTNLKSLEQDSLFAVIDSTDQQSNQTTVEQT